MNYRILAVADDGITFDRAHAKAMSLPFARGWASWSVYRQDGKNLIHVADFDNYGAAEQFTMQLTFPVTELPVDYRTH